MEDIQKIIYSYVLWPIPRARFVRNFEDTEISQIEIILRQLSNQLKFWKKLVQYFYIVSQDICAAEQLISNSIKDSLL